MSTSDTPETRVSHQQFFMSLKDSCLRWTVNCLGRTRGFPSGTPQQKENEAMKRVPQATPILSGGYSAAMYNNLEEFRCFRELPIELRLKIWKYALPRGVDDDGERILTVKIQIVSQDPVKGIDINFSVPMPGDYAESGTQQTYLKGSVEEFTADLRNVTLLSTCMESRTVVLDTFKNELPMVKNGVLRYDDKTIICIPNWCRSLIRRPIQAALAARLPVPIFPIKHFTTNANSMVAMLANDLNCARNLSLFAGLKTVTFGTQHLGQPESSLPRYNYMIDYKDMIDRSNSIFRKCVLGFMLEVFTRYEALNPGFNIPQLGGWGEKANGVREMNWEISAIDEKDFLQTQRSAAARDICYKYGPYKRVACRR